MAQHLIVDERSEYSGGTSVGAKCGFVVGVLVGIISLAVGLFLSFFGDCPPGAPCHDGEGRRFLLVIFVSLLLAGATGAIVRWAVNDASRGN
jgi:hypothetical protein